MMKISIVVAAISIVVPLSAPTTRVPSFPADLPSVVGRQLPATLPSAIGRQLPVSLPSIGVPSLPVRLPSSVVLPHGSMRLPAPKTLPVGFLFQTAAQSRKEDTRPALKALRQMTETKKEGVKPAEEAGEVFDGGRAPEPQTFTLPELDLEHELGVTTEEPAY